MKLTLCVLAAMIVLCSAYVKRQTTPVQCASGAACTIATTTKPTAATTRPTAATTRPTTATTRPTANTTKPPTFKRDIWTDISQKTVDGVLYCCPKYYMLSWTRCDTNGYITNTCECLGTA